MTAANNFDTPWGSLAIQRWPVSRSPALQGWDGADRLLIACAAEQPLPPSCWVINEHWGAVALAMSLAGAKVVAWQDGFCHRQALFNNAGLLSPTSRWLFEQPEPDSAPACVMMRIPKDSNLLNWQLSWVNQMCPAGTPVRLAGLDKHLPGTLKSMLSSSLEQLQTERGRFKAHLFRGLTHASKPADWPWKHQTLGEGEPGLWTLPGVFAANAPDPGGRFLMEHLPDYAPEGLAVDLGCGSGMVGMALKTRFPQVPVLFSDDSWLAVKACQRNLSERGWCSPEVMVRHADGLRDFAEPAGLVLLNPPFHSGHAVDVGPARRLIRHAATGLVPGGELRLVCNRHLDYRRVLGRHFEKVRQVAENRRFRVISALKD